MNYIEVVRINERYHNKGDKMETGEAVTTCAECGMIISRRGEYHPYAACLIFKACGSGSETRANLSRVVDYGMRTSKQKRSLESGMLNLTNVRPKAR